METTFVGTGCNMGNGNNGSIFGNNFGNDNFNGNPGTLPNATTVYVWQYRQRQRQCQNHRQFKKLENSLSVTSKNSNGHNRKTIARLKTIATSGTIASYLPRPSNVWDIAILPSACSKSSELTIASPKGEHVSKGISHHI